MRFQLSGFDPRPRASRPDGLDASLDELDRTVGVMNVAAAVESLENDVPTARLQLGYGLRVAVLEHAAHGRNALQASDAQAPQSDGIVASVVVDIAKATHAQQGIEDKQAPQQREAGVARPPRDGRNAFAQPG